MTLCDRCKYEEVRLSMEAEIAELLRVSWATSHRRTSCIATNVDLLHQAEQQALSNEAARYLEEDFAPTHIQECGAAFGGSSADFRDGNTAEDASAGDSVCTCPICHACPFLFQMEWVLRICGYGFNEKAQQISIHQLKCLLQLSTEMHCSSGCAAEPSCIFEVCF
jgi:hypothetical protein